MMAQTRPFGVCPRNAFFVVELIMESFSSEMHSFRSHVLIYKIQEQKQHPTPTLHYLNFWRDVDNAYAMKTVDSTSCWLALLFIIVSLSEFYPSIAELPIGGSFDRYIQPYDP
jgi:hypothetical protein